MDHCPDTPPFRSNLLHITRHHNDSNTLSLMMFLKLCSLKPIIIRFSMKLRKKNLVYTVELAEGMQPL
jgi:hypothetical protein